MKILYVLVLSAIIVGGPGCQAATGPDTNSGILGQLYEIGAPAVPVGWIPPPLRAVKAVAVFDSVGIIVKDVETDSLGSFGILLLPGKYALRIMDRFSQPVHGPFIVPKGTIISVKLYHDNGIR